MAKESCAVCGTTLNKRNMVRLEDGYVCADCLCHAGIPASEEELSCSTEVIRETQKLVDVFQTTRVAVEGLFVLDEIHELFRFDYNTFRFSDLVEYNKEEEETQASGRLFGRGKGAVQTTVTIELKLRNAFTEQAYLTLESEKYGDYRERAERSMEALKYISDQNRGTRSGGAKKICVSCRKPVDSLVVKALDTGAYVCAGCLDEAGIPFTSALSRFSLEAVQNLIARRKELLPMFHATQSLAEGLFEVDEDHELFRAGGQVFEYSNLKGFEPVEGGSGVPGAAPDAAMSSAPEGGTGAAPEGGAGARACRILKIQLTLKNTYTDSVSIDFITPGRDKAVKTDDPAYRGYQEKLQQCLDALELIADRNRSREHGAGAPDGGARSSFSAADEILKFRNLLELGAVSQEEYDAKKKQLLGL